jgi:acetylornithine deacetylase/succinyl-diaminopimelate desuccinylase-like protein
MTLTRLRLLCAAALLAPPAARGQTLPPPEHQKLAHDILAELVAINTTAAKGSTAAAQALAARFKAAGFPDSDVVLLGPNPAHQNIIVRYRGDGTGGKPILFLAHLDVVEAEPEHWTTDPFKLTERDGFYYGRGSFDIKDEVADLSANFIRLKREGFIPSRDLMLVFTDGEEGAESDDGARWLVANHRDLVDVEYVINTDAAGGQIVKGRHRRNPVQTSEKVYVTYTLEVTSPGGHSSEPVPDNAIYHLAAGLHRFSRFDFPVKLTETTRAYFRAISREERGQLAADLLALTQTPPDRKAVARLRVSPFYHAMMGNTCVATMVNAGHAENALPERAVATIQCRLLPGQDPEQVRRTIVGVVADSAISVKLANRPVPSPASPIRPALMTTIERITSQMWPGTITLPVMDVWSSDGPHFRRAGIPVYGLSAVFYDVDHVTSHGVDERVGINEFYEGVEFMYRFVQAVGRGRS